MPNKTKGKAAKSPKTKPKTKSSAGKKPPVQATKAANPKLPNVLEIARASWLTLWHNRKTVSLIVLMYGIVYLILVLGLSSPTNAASVKNEFSGVFHGNLRSLYSGLSVFSYLVGSSASSSTPAGSAYQIFIIITASLSIVWALRQFYLGTKIRARDSYYQGLYPLVPYILVLLFIVIELLPLIAGLGLYGLLIGGSIAVTILEKLLSLILIFGLIGFSMYLISSSVISLYIVTLPNMSPLKALRSAKGLVRGRRWSVFRKMIFLPLLLLIAGGIVMLPFILVAPALASWVFFILTLFALVYIHSYLYSLYRGLINE
jgi:hypothetical protein